MKKTISLILAMILALSLSTVSLAAEPISSSTIKISPTSIPDSMLNMTNEDILDTYRIAAIKNANKTERMSVYAVSVSYTVNAVCDNEWITALNATGIGGLDAAEFIIDEISEKFEEWAGIQLTGYAVKKDLTSTSSNYVVHLNEAKNNYGIGSRELMIAFSGIPSSTVGVVGGAYIEEPYSILFYAPYDVTWQVGRHETGHMFGAQQGTAANDYDCSDECVMNDACTTNSRYDKICSSCKSLVNAHKNDYK